MISSEILQKALNWRYATKAFDPNKKLSAEQWTALSESLRLAPSSYGLQPWRFYVVQNPTLRSQLREVSWNQSQVTDCSHFVVFTIRNEMTETDVDAFIQSTAKTRGMDPAVLDGYKGMMIGDLVKGPRAQIAKWWAQRQAYIAMGFLMESAALLSVDTCPLEGLDPEAYDRILNLTGTGYSTVAAVAVGFRSEQDKYASLKKVRYPAEHVIKLIE